MQNKLIKIALAIVLFNTTLHFDQIKNVDYLEKEHSLTAITNDFNTGWHWGFNTAQAETETIEVYAPSGLCYGVTLTACYDYYNDEFNELYDAEYDNDEDFGDGSSGSNTAESSTEERQGLKYTEKEMISISANLLAIKKALDATLAVKGLSPKAIQLIKADIALLTNAISKSNILATAIAGTSMIALDLAEDNFAAAVGTIAGIVTGLAVGTVSAAPLTVVGLSIVASSVVSWGTEETIKNLSRTYDIVMIEYENSTSIWDEFYCEFTNMFMQSSFCEAYFEYQDDYYYDDY